MAQLKISLLGAFHVSRNGETITTFRTDKVRALLAYLVVESDRVHARKALAALLWPEVNERSANQNLRQALYMLRQAINDKGNSPFGATRKEI